ncbi:MAG TPA: hypothetical protein VM899_11915 [Rubellimicrobium sp.]|nr:hypothetical protein [Rubellimicrobium sp.]
MPEISNETEVDSVLLAIRRLIQEGRPEGQGVSMGRLMLTPAFRVDGPAEPLVLTAPAPVTPGGLDLALAASDTLVLMNAMAPAAPPALGPSDPMEAELSGDPGALDAGVLDFASAPANPDAADPSPAQAPLGPSDPVAAELSVDLGALEASLADGSDATPPTPPAAAVPDAPDGEEADPSDPTESAPDPAAPPAPLPPLVLTQDQQQPSDMGRTADPGSAPDALASQRSGDLSLDPADPAPTDPTHASEASLVDEQPAPDSLPPAALLNPLLPDEAALRALVAEVLREELRGELGERLTRNLRKLVRREVMQALSLREG